MKTATNGVYRIAQTDKLNLPTHSVDTATFDHVATQNLLVQTTLVLEGMPTSPVGLKPGQIWIDNGMVKVAS